MSGPDARIEALARRLARTRGRRSFLARAGRWLMGATGLAALPLLPIARSAPAAVPTSGPANDGGEGPEGDPKHCEYWRHCAIDGFLCSCCGGSATTCPPGTEMSPVTWIGTCHNPSDDKHYLISYNDCCGKSFCGRCLCNRNEGERPDYHWVRANDINWCAGAESQSYHCSVAIVLGEASGPQPER